MESFIYIIIACGILIYEFTRKKKCPVDFQSVYLFFFGCYYVLPGIVFGLTRLFNASFENRYPGYEEPNFLAPIIILLFLLSSLAGFSVNMRNRLPWAPIIVQQKGFNAHILVLLLFIGVAFLGFLINSLAFGGPIGLLKNAWAYRHMATDAEGVQVLFQNSSGGFYVAIGRRLMPGIRIVFIAAFSMWLYNQLISKKLTAFSVFMFATMVYMLTIMANMSRGLLITSIIMPLILYCNYRRRIDMKSVLAGVPIILFLIIFGKPFFKSLTSLQYGFGAFTDALVINFSDVSLTSLFSFFIEIVQNFSHRIASTIVAVNNFGTHPEGIRHIKDFINVPLSWVGPFLGYRQPDSITDINTMLMIGSLYKYVPPGIVAFSFYSLWWIGPMIYGFLFGYAANATEEIHLRNWHRHSWVPGLHAFFAMYFGFGMLGFDPRTIANGLFSIIPLLVVMRVYLVWVQRSDRVPQ